MLDIDHSTCFWTRLHAAEDMVASGAWASGHEVATRLRDCARHAGCDRRTECATAAGTLIGAIRRQVCEAT